MCDSMFSEIIQIVLILILLLEIKKEEQRKILNSMALDAKMICENIESHIIYFFTIEKILKNSIAMFGVLIEIVRKSFK